jgi:tellurite resistance protein TerC
MIFSYFGVPLQYQHRVLFWGLLGAFGLRLAFILGGVALLEHFHWLTYVLGVFLILTGIKMARKSDHTVDPKRNPVFRLLKPVMVPSGYTDGRFLVRERGRIRVTELMVVLLVVESTDVVFALDSVPAVLAITTDPFIVYTSNALAILGLRSLYFAISGSIEMFHHLHYGLAVILVFVGGKMLLAHVYKLPVKVVLPVIILILLVSIAASRLWPKPTEAR